MTPAAVWLYSAELVHRHGASRVTEPLETQQACSASHLDTKLRVKARSVTVSEFKKGPWRYSQAQSSLVTHTTLKPHVEVHPCTIWQSDINWDGWILGQIKRSLPTQRQLYCQACYAVTNSSEAWHDEIPASLLLPRWKPSLLSVSLHCSIKGDQRLEGKIKIGQISYQLLLSLACGMHNESSFLFTYWNTLGWGQLRLHPAYHGVLQLFSKFAPLKSLNIENLNDS